MTYLHLAFPLLCTASLAGLVWHFRAASRRSRSFLVVALLATLLFAWPPIAWLASGTLEWWYAAVATPTLEADAIVVLSGYVTKADGVPPLQLLAEDSYVRCQHAVWLYKNWREVPILICGGKGRAEIMRDELLTRGIPAEDVLLETESTSTYENARFGAIVLKDRGIEQIALVTEAHHMLRSELCFQHQGLHVVPAPCAFRASKFIFWPGMFLPGGQAISENEETVHEWLGILWYWSRGYL